MVSRPCSNAATAAGTSASAIGRNETIGQSGRGHEGGPAALEGVNIVRVAQGEADVVPPVEEPLTGELVEWEGAGEAGRRRLDRAPCHVDRQFERGILRNGVQELAVEVLRHLYGEQSLLGAVVAEDVGEAGRD